MKVFEAFQEVYISFSSWSSTGKFYFSLFVALVFFLYKTFLTMYTENEKAKQATDLKASEQMSKLMAQMAVYFGGAKDGAAQDRIITSLGEAYPYFNYRMRSKIQMYYANRSDAALRTLQKLVNERAEFIINSNEKQTGIEKMLAFNSRIIRPFFPILILIVLLIFAILSQEKYFSLRTGSEQAFFLIALISGAISIIFATAFLDLLIADFKNMRRKSLVFWIGTVSLIFAPLLTILVSGSLSLASLLLQVVAFLIMLLKK